MMLEILRGHLGVSMPLGSFSAMQHYHSAKTKVGQGREECGGGGGGGEVHVERRERERREERSCMGKGRE